MREDGVTSEGAKAAKVQFWKLVRIHNKSRREQIKKQKKKGRRRRRYRTLRGTPTTTVKDS